MCLRQLPTFYLDLESAIGERGAGQGEKVSGSLEPDILINVHAEAVSTDMVNIIASWAGRVAHVADLHIDADRPLRAYAGGPFGEMCAMLASHVDALFALGRESMTRFLTMGEADALPAGTPIRRNYIGNYAEFVAVLGGHGAVTIQRS